MNIANIKANETILPHWAEAAKKALLVQPSSAASERVLNNTFGKRQNSSLDYVESCIMLQYNNQSLIFGHKIGHNRAKIMAMPKNLESAQA